LWDGKQGSTSQNYLRAPENNEFGVKDLRRELVKAGGAIIIESAGGGGWGSPLDRDAAAVRTDVIEELVSREAAETDYGVVLRDDLTLDETATTQRRHALRSAQSVGQ
jgi:N-methylhydantoinase B